MSKPLPRHLTEEELSVFFKVCKTSRDRAMFMLMLRCGLRVAEVVGLTLGDIDLRRRRLVRGIQKRMEYYAKKTGLRVSCHALRHTMATQMLNADAELVTIQDLLGHRWITTTQRYCRISNRKVQRDYYRAMEMVMQKDRFILICSESEHTEL